MKSLFKDTILRISLLILTVTGISIESKAQITTIDRFLMPFVNSTYESNGMEEAPTVELSNDKSYLDNRILIFRENFKVCKDIVTGSTNSDTVHIDSKNENSENCKFCNDTIARKQNTTTITPKKKRSKKYRNFPGNIRSKI